MRDELLPETLQKKIPYLVSCLLYLGFLRENKIFDALTQRQIRFIEEVHNAIKEHCIIRTFQKKRKEKK